MNIDDEIDQVSYKHIEDALAGSGCIILSILKDNKNLSALGIDISFKAINIAQKNSMNLNLEKQATFIVSNWLSPISDFYDLIISNPP